MQQIRKHPRVTSASVQKINAWFLFNIINSIYITQVFPEMCLEEKEGKKYIQTVNFSKAKQ